MTDVIGYIASFTVLISFLMKDIKTLRIVNSIGCSLFVGYGLLGWDLPVIITNMAILGINIYYLLKTRKS